MAQRSQIFVMIDGELAVASDYSWNFGERMISRLRYGAEYLRSVFTLPKVFTRVGSLCDGNERLRRMFDVNFDMFDIQISRDIFKEYERDHEMVPFRDFALGEDNTDGRLFVMADSRTKTVKYILSDYDGNYMDAEQYLAWDVPGWQNDMIVERDKVYSNLSAIKRKFQVMNDEEIAFFMEHMKMTLKLDEIERNLNSRSIYVVLEDGSDLLVQENGIDYERCCSLYGKGCNFYFD